MSGLSKESKVGVIGAGAMGAGIAQVAAAAGHQVVLYDVAEGAGQKGKSGIAKGLSKLVERGKKQQADVDDLLARVKVSENLYDLADAALIVEAIVENLDVKRKVFSDLESLCRDKTIIASNTSSLSISSLAAKMQIPERLVGMHFFNPAPILKLVEVVSGLQTSKQVADTVFDTASEWGKLAIHVKSSPGFVVNRVARPFYAEALKSLQEQAADVATIDALVKGSGGFRMGPFELIDLIGLDVNYAVTCSVFDAYYQDKRFQPSLIQKEMVDAGLLGRKTGKGFYDYDQQASSTETTLAEQAKPSAVTVYGDLSVASDVLDLVNDSDITVDRKVSEDNYIEIDGVQLRLTNGLPATLLAKQNNHANTVAFDLALDYKKASHIGLASALQADKSALNIAAGFFQALGKQACEIKDVPGMLVMRTVCMLCNEGADTVNQGVCDIDAVDIAMLNGVNYPRGPMQWGEQIGLGNVVEVLNNLMAVYGEDRYRCSPLLRTLTAASS